MCNDIPFLLGMIAAALGSLSLIGLLLVLAVTRLPQKLQNHPQNTPPQRQSCCCPYPTGIEQTR